MIEHIPEDMTVTVTGEVTLVALQGELGRRRQWLPVDPPNPEPLTISDLINSNASGPRRFGYGTIRDYFIGIKVALADGTVIRSGGKVVKNVAGYDLLKLFVGSRGSLGTVLEGTFKLRPLPEREQFVRARAESLETADKLVEALMRSQVTPVVLDLHRLENQAMAVVVGFAGTREEVEWQVATVRELGLAESATLEYDTAFWSDAGTVNRLSVLPSRIFGAIRGLGDIPFVARAGNGVIYHRGTPAAREHPLPVALMRRLKDAYDPKHLLPELPP